ncbi:MAG: flagellar biosynthesis regulator FlaF [Pseudomonadota bacterium]
MAGAAPAVSGGGYEASFGAYGQARAATATPRSMEYAAFGRVTGALTKVATADDLSATAAALHDNLKLWAALAADLAGDGNAYPESLRAQLISLAAFVQRHSRAVLAGQATVAPLIDINTAVMRGLRGADAVA